MTESTNRAGSTPSLAAKVAVVGGGPAGSVAALCLRKLGRHVELFEKETFPRYQLGESLLPGTVSILKRLGLFERIEAAGFPRKRAATFLWGADRKPWTFSFATPKTDPWVSDHAYQVDRAAFDQILLGAARERGAEVHEQRDVEDVETDRTSGALNLTWRNGSSSGAAVADWLVDASGRHGLMASKLGLRRHDDYFKALAIWTYYEGAQGLTGGLAGNVVSATLDEGWAWLIPLRDGRHSVGLVTDPESAKAFSGGGLEKENLERFFEQTLQSSDAVRGILAGGTRCAPIRATRDWAYEATRCSVDRAFLCGDAAFFVDPLFSQGVHLAVYSGTLAAAAIDRILDHAEDTDEVHTWYDASFRRAYEGYHEFLTSFYACNATRDSGFWSRRRIEAADDPRFRDHPWFTDLDGVDAPRAIKQRALDLGDLWEHADLSADFDATALSLRRLRWASERSKRYKRMTAVHWTGREARLVPSFRLDKESFRLRRVRYLANETDRTLHNVCLTQAHCDLFGELAESPATFDDLFRALRRIAAENRGAADLPAPQRILDRLFDHGLLRGFNREGDEIPVPSVLRFGGVGAEDDLS